MQPPVALRIRTAVLPITLLVLGILIPASFAWPRHASDRQTQAEDAGGPLTLELASSRAGEAPAHRLTVQVNVGDPEIHHAVLDHPEGFSFRGLQPAAGAEQAAVGAFEVDADFDGQPERTAPLIAQGTRTAFADVIGDGAFNRDVEPELRVTSDTTLELTLPFGGDANPSTRSAPLAARLSFVLFEGALQSPALSGRYVVGGRLTSVDPDTDGADDGFGGAPVSRAFRLPIAIDGPRLIAFSTLAPRAVPGLRGIVAVAAGNRHALALSDTGVVWSWGDNSEGQLGEGRADLASQTFPAPVRGLPAIRAIAAGYAHSLALDVTGAVWAWGRNESGELGDRGFEPNSVPVREGNLGNGTAEVDEPTPVPIGGLADVVEAELTISRGLARTASGSLWQWGPGPFDDEFSSLAPRLVALSEVTAIAAGYDQALAVLDCGQVWAWGSNGSSQLGAGGFDQSSLPTPVPGIGGDSGCAKVTLDVVAAGDAPPLEFLTLGLGPAHWTGSRYRVTLDRGTAVTIGARTPIQDEGERTLQFARWTVDCDGSDRQISFVMDRSRLCAAVYENVSADPVLLSVVSDGGLVTSAPEAGILGPTHIDCRDGGPVCQTVFKADRTIDLSAQPSPGFAFSGWGGSCSGIDLETTVRMDGPKSCAANFRPYTLDVAVTGAGRVVSVPAGIDCGAVCSTTPRAADATLIATADLGWEFVGWDGHCAGSADEITVEMNADRTCTATFRRDSGTFLLTLTIEGQGTVSSQPVGIACPGTCVAEFAAGTFVDLTAAPGPGWMVSLWLDDCLNPGVPSRRLFMDEDKQCRLQFLGQPAFPVAGFTNSASVNFAHVGDVVTFNGLESHMFDPVTGARDFSGIRQLAWDLDADGVLDVHRAAARPRGSFSTPFRRPVSFPLACASKADPSIWRTSTSARCSSWRPTRCSRR